MSYYYDKNLDKMVRKTERRLEKLKIIQAIKELDNKLAYLKRHEALHGME